MRRLPVSPSLLHLSMILTTTLAFTVPTTRRSIPFTKRVITTTTSRLFSATSSSSSSAATTSSSDKQQSQEWSTDSVRAQFLSYFSSKNHTLHPSSPCIPPPSDQSLLFTNAGMNQFKSIFLNQVPPNTPLAALKTAANSQKCIRAGGKHNDLEDVGKDSYHHTFFEMLGSWSFGEYFKEEAIDMAWDLLVNVYGLDPERLYATYFEGNDQVPADTEALSIWKKHLPPSRILACSAKDNFWEMGDTGPCGPCTEIHYDRIGNRDASALVNADDPDVIEIWNVVFIQFNRDEDEGAEGGTSLRSLPQKHVDTGMGLERLVSILQNVRSNYDIDTFQKVISSIETVKGEGVAHYQGRYGKDDDDLVDTAYRAVADHVRALCFAIGDGAVVSNEGRGYVLRRILRRAERYGQQILKAEMGFLTKVAPVVIDTFSTSFPELETNRDIILSTLLSEEESFSTMLERGIKHFTTLQSTLSSQDQTTIPGQEAFFLYDTLGFPLDLTQLMALEAGLDVDAQGFNEAMEDQKRRSREAQKKARAAGSGVVDMELGTDDTAALENAGVEVTMDDDKYNVEDVPSIQATVAAVYSDDSSKDDDDGTITVGVVLDRTNFYAEAGGQECDKGDITLTNGVTLSVADVRVYAGYILHVGTIPADAPLPNVGDTVTVAPDRERRRRIVPNHTATHLLNAALREVLGDTVLQKGSSNNEERLRFDFSHDSAMSVKQLRKVETIVNDIVTKELDVQSELLPLAQAQELDGVVAVFGEVYPDPVRVVRVGESASVEFCGGTHIRNTREVESFVILEEGAVAKGIRRITAVTRDAALQAKEDGDNFEKELATVESSAATPETLLTLDKTAGTLRKTLDALSISTTRKATFRDRIETLQRNAAKAQKAQLDAKADAALNIIKQQIDNMDTTTCNTLVTVLDLGLDGKATQKVMNLCKQKQISFLGISEEDPNSGGKVMVFAVCPDETGDLKANEWVAAALECVGGRGGGRAGNAQGQAPTGDVGTILTVAKEFAASKVGAEVV